MRERGVGPITSMAFVLTIGDVKRFQRGKQVASYLGLIPREYSSGGHQRLGSISKQGNTFLRMLLVEAAQGAVRCDPGFRNEYFHRCHSKTKGGAKVAAARQFCALTTPSLLSMSGIVWYAWTWPKQPTRYRGYGSNATLRTVPF